MADAMEALIDAIADRVRLRIYIDFTEQLKGSNDAIAEHADHLMRLESRIQDIENDVDLDDKITEAIQNLNFEVRVR